MLKSAAGQRGISLTELMISLSIGVLLMLGLTTFMSGTVVNNTSSIKTIQFNQEMRAAMTMMVRDLRRAGYWGSPNYTAGALSGVGFGTAYSNPFANVDTSTAGCILYRYDKNGNSTLESGEYFGFQLSGTGIQMLSNGSSGNACGGSSGWTNLTNLSNLKVTGLTFAETDSSPVYTNGTSSGPNIKVRYVTITLTAQCATDTKIQQTLQETIRLGNDLFSPS
ncbi:MAG: prepilin-type N-terminal cleavage/methylation domain-containing protein [Proteobacteria bacterium]|nr:prepilin-type N-terminal cleavage/methylation domain-containing protein [Pseudomonadota bacterium]